MENESNSMDDVLKSNEKAWFRTTIRLLETDETKYSKNMPNLYQGDILDPYSDDCKNINLQYSKNSNYLAFMTTSREKVIGLVVC